MNKLIKQVNTMNSGVSSSNNKLVVSIQTSYSFFSKNVEQSYDTFCINVLYTLKYFFGHRQYSF